MSGFPEPIIEASKIANQKWKVPASVSLAQWALESGWGAHSPGNNPYGMKPRKGLKDPQQELMTTEVLFGKKVRKLQPFRLFGSISEAIDAHAELLATAPVYAEAMAELPNVDKFVSEMSHHYATDPLYYGKVMSVINVHHLTQYDLKG